MSMIIDGTNGLTFNNSTTQASAGVVLQVVQASTTTGVNTASTSPVDSNLTATITPKFNTSKILISVNQSLGKETSATASALLNLVRGSSTLTNIAAYLAYTGTTTPFYGTTCAYQYLDSPATTSATTYKTQVYCNTAGGNALAQPNNSPSTITLMEIAA
jgi:hypothetical protein